MRKTILAAAVAMAFMGVANAENPTTIDSDVTVQLESTESGKGQSAYRDVNITGNSGSTLTISGPWQYAIRAENQGVSVSGLSALSINLDIRNFLTSGQYDVNALQAVNGNTLSITNTDNVSVTTVGDPSKVISPIPIHAYGGTVEMDVKGNIDIVSDTNAIMVQQSGTKAGTVSLKAGGDITIKSAHDRYAAVLVGALTPNKTENASGSLELIGQNVTIRSQGWDAILLYDDDWKYDGTAGTIQASIQAKDSVRIEARRFGISQNRVQNGAQYETGLDITANNSVSIAGGVSAIRIKQDGTTGTANTIEIGAPNVLLTSDGAQDEGASYATLDVGAKSAVTFQNGEQGSTHVTITNNGTGNAVSIASQGTVTASNATLNIARGDIAAQGGTMNLTNTRLELGEGVTMNLGTLEGSNNTVVLNSIAEEGKTVTITSITSGAEGVSNLVAGGTLNDKYADASQLKEAMGNAVSLTSNSETVIPIYSGEAGAAAGAWTENADGSITREANKGLEAFKEFNSATFAQWRAENNHLSQRLGDLRGNMGKAGAWARVYGTDAEISENVSVDLKTVSIQVGGDVTVGNNWVVGGAFTYTNMDGDISNGAADSDSYSLAAYASGFFDCGGYIDVIGRVGRLSTDVTGDTGSVAGGVFDGSYDNTAFGLSAEVGYHWNVTSMFYVEPQVELAYGFVSGDDFTSSNGANVEQDDFQSLVGRLGARFGANFADNKGSVYMHASVNHDFLGDVDATAGVDGGARFDISNDLGGTWVSYGVGAQFNTSANMSFYGMLERANGSEYTEHYRYSVGMRYTF